MRLNGDSARFDKLSVMVCGSSKLNCYTRRGLSGFEERPLTYQKKDQPRNRSGDPEGNPPIERNGIGISTALKSQTPKHSLRLNYTPRNMRMQ
jgi:hypothetical protein